MISRLHPSADTDALAISPDTAFLGRRRLGEAELRDMYGEALHVPPEYVRSNMLVLNDLFSLSEACLLADGVSTTAKPTTSPNPGHLLCQQRAVAMPAIHAVRIEC